MGPHVVGVNFFATNFFYSDYFKKMHNTDHTVYFNFFFSMKLVPQPIKLEKKNTKIYKIKGQKAVVNEYHNRQGILRCPLT